MQRFTSLIFFLLLCSVALNVYQFAQTTPFSWLEQTQQRLAPENNRPTGQNDPVKKNKFTNDGAQTAAESDSNSINDHEEDLTDVEPKADKFKLAQALFSKGRYVEAVAIFEELFIEDEQQALDLKQIWQAALQQRLKNADYVTIDSFLTVFLQSYPYDQTFLAINAELLAALDRIPEAIQIYYSLISYSFEIKEEEYYQARIRHLATTHFEVLEKNLSWQAALDFSYEILQQEPGYPPYLLSQALAMIKLGQLNNAIIILEPLLDISFYTEQAKALLKQIDKLRLQQTAIKLHPLGEHYLVSGQINQTHPVSLMIDTGASMSVLTQAQFDQIESWSNPQYMGETLLNTAGGQVKAPIYQFERFQIEQFSVENMSFVVLAIENMTNYDGLLGMNFLKQFKFSIDQQNNLLILSP